MSTNGERTTNLSVGSALLAAFAASSCCLGPLLFAAIGVGGAGATAALAVYRPYLLVGTAVLLISGFYFAYHKPRGADACGCEPSRANRLGRIGLWIAAAVVVLVAAGPPLLAQWAEASRLHASTTGSSLAKATIHAQGIDCEACALPMRKALAKVGGFRDLELDIPKQTIAVTYEPAPGRLDAYVTAINDLGYGATLGDKSEARR